MQSRLLCLFQVGAILRLLCFFQVGAILPILFFRLGSMKADALKLRESNADPVLRSMVERVSGFAFDCETLEPREDVNRTQIRSCVLW